MLSLSNKGKSAMDLKGRENWKMYDVIIFLPDVTTKLQMPSCCHSLVVMSNISFL